MNLYHTLSMSFFLDTPSQAALSNAIIVRRILHYVVAHDCPMKDVVYPHICSNDERRHIWKLRILSHQFYECCTCLFFQWFQSHSPSSRTCYCNRRSVNRTAFKWALDTGHGHKIRVVKLDLSPQEVSIASTTDSLNSSFHISAVYNPQLGEEPCANIRLDSSFVKLPHVEHVILSFQSCNHPDGIRGSTVNEQIRALLWTVRSCFPSSIINMRLVDKYDWITELKKLSLLQGAIQHPFTIQSLVHFMKTPNRASLFPDNMAGLSKLFLHAYPLAANHYDLIRRNSKTLIELSASGIRPGDLSRIVIGDHGENIDFRETRRLAIGVIRNFQNIFPAQLSFAERFPMVTYMRVVSDIWPVPAYVVGVDSLKLSRLVLEHPQGTNRMIINGAGNNHGDIMCSVASCPALKDLVVFQQTQKGHWGQLSHRRIHACMLNLPPSMLSFAFHSTVAISGYTLPAASLDYFRNLELRMLTMPKVGLGISQLLLLLDNLHHLHSLSIRIAVPRKRAVGMTRREIESLASLVSAPLSPLQNLVMTNQGTNRPNILSEYAIMVAVASEYLKTVTVHLDTDSFRRTFAECIGNPKFSMYRDKLLHLELCFGEKSALVYRETDSRFPFF